MKELLKRFAAINVSPDANCDMHYKPLYHNRFMQYLITFGCKTEDDMKHEINSATSDIMQLTNVNYDLFGSPTWCSKIALVFASFNKKSDDDSNEGKLGKRLKEIYRLFTKNGNGVEDGTLHILANFERGYYESKARIGELGVIMLELTSVTPVLFGDSAKDYPVKITQLQGVVNGLNAIIYRLRESKLLGNLQDLENGW